MSFVDQRHCLSSVASMKLTSVALSLIKSSNSDHRRADSSILNSFTHLAFSRSILIVSCLVLNDPITGLNYRKHPSLLRHQRSAHMNAFIFLV